LGHAPVRSGAHGQYEMGSIAFQATAPPPTWSPIEGTAEADTGRNPSVEQALAALTLILWGLVMPIDFTISLLAV
jgi:hypothetical protein